MSTHTRAGVRAAKTLLSLVEENSIEELEAAEYILGSEKELTNILQLLRKYKEHEEEPLTTKRLREIVRAEILKLPLSIKEMVQTVNAMVQGEPIRAPAGLTIEDLLNQAFPRIEALDLPPGQLVDRLVGLLVLMAHRAGPDHEVRIVALLRDLAIQAVTENRIFFPTAYSLAQLRLRWAKEALPHKSQESRRSLVKRLLVDVEQLPEKAQAIEVIGDLLREGLRSPADAEFKAMQRLRTKKAHGE